MKRINPNHGIDSFTLGTSLSNLLKQINDEQFTVHELDNAFVITSQYYKFWINKQSNLMTQVMVYGCYDGKVLGRIGIGDSLIDVKSKLGSWYEDQYVYKIREIPGVCFELKDIEEYDDNWNRLSAPIEFITVYKE